MTQPRNTKKTLQKGLFLGFLLLIASYTYLKTENMIEGPQIDLAAPTDGMTTNSSLVKISGIASNISYIHLNDRKIYTNENGSFDEELLLYPGYNLITIDAEDRYGRKTVKTVEIVYKKPEQQDDGAIIGQIDEPTNIN